MRGGTTHKDPSSYEQRKPKGCGGIDDLVIGDASSCLAGRCVLCHGVKRSLHTPKPCKNSRGLFVGSAQENKASYQ